MNPGQPSPANSTYRNVVRVSAGGAQVRVELTNEFGARPLTIGAAHIAVSAGTESSTGAIQAGSDHALTFNGQTSVTIPAGAPVFSDPVPMEVAALSSLAVSVYLPAQKIDDETCHPDARSTTLIAMGDATAAETLADTRPVYSWCFVKAIDVTTHASNAAAIVCLGDSITDGALSTRDANHRWPDVLARRLQADPKTAHLSVLNEGIGGNRLLHDGAGPNALARLDRDVLAQSGVKYLILLEGINDIGRTAQPRDPGDPITAQDAIFALTQLVTSAHAHHIKVFGATLTPYLGAGYASPAGEQMRQTINQWIRTGGAFDGVIDFDQVARDPAKPTQFAADVDSGDHLHPGDAGYEKMGSSIDLSIFQ
ncbi:MAG TPA: SGNH/GDSL hydrolase family protein [Acidobacteriaceae bacterium]|nr:SGNH/GDSL hydrolase family protein [Acidobacteriaceae bacterium]